MACSDDAKALSALRAVVREYVAALDARRALNEMGEAPFRLLKRANQRRDAAERALRAADKACR